MKIFEALVGTETFGYRNEVHVNHIHLHLEPIDYILTGELYEPRSEYGVSTEQYAFMLNQGNIDITHTLFVSPEFLAFSNEQYKRVRHVRKMFVSKRFYDQIISSTTQFVSHAIPEPNTDNKEVNERIIELDFNKRVLALAHLCAALEIVENRNIPDFSSMGIGTPNAKVVTGLISKKAKELQAATEYIEETIDIVQLKTILRAPYLKILEDS